MNNLDDRYKIVKEIFNHQLRVTEHEDNKAGRIILSISFIATAAASIFNTFLYNHIQLVIYSIDVIPLIFLVIIIFTILGVYIILWGIGPKYTNVNKIEEEPYCPTSIFYFVKICKEDSNKWKKYLNSEDINIIKEKAIEDLINESHTIANRIDKKDFFIYWGKRCFYISLISTIIMTILGVYIYI